LVAAAAFAAFTSFFGFIPGYIGNESQQKTIPHYRGNKQFSYGYKKLPTARSVKVAPWEIASALGAIWLIYYCSAVNTHLGIKILEGLGALIVVSGIIYAISGGWKQPVIKQARSNIRAAWDRACPQLVVEQSED
jgi:hypothetical protein